MESKRYLVGFLFVILMGFFTSSQARKFSVGGKNGWVLNPSENYNKWAERNRFQVNDTLFFKYKKDSDSVLVVTKDHYQSCNTTNPIQSLTGGDSSFKLERSGPFYFISGLGNGDSCQKGQKLIVVVLAVRDKARHSTPPSPSPVAAASPPEAKSPKGDQSPQPAGETPSDVNAPALTPSGKSSGAAGFSIGSAWLVLCISIGVSVVFSSFMGVV